LKAVSAFKHEALACAVRHLNDVILRLGTQVFARRAWFNVELFAKERCGFRAGLRQARILTRQFARGNVEAIGKSGGTEGHGWQLSF
jgi:hypothetical protein